MKKLQIFITLFPFWAFGQTADYPIQPVDFTKVKITGGFWKSRLDTVSHRTIPYAFQKCEETGRINNFIFAGKLAEGKFKGSFGFDDSDVYKIMEGASYALMNEANPKMDAYLDKIISYMAAAQEPDGYLYTAWSLKANDYNKFQCCTYDPAGKFVGDKMSHELYNAGHMYEAAVAHYRATKKKTFLNIATKNADLIYHLAVDKKQGFYSGHQEIEVGLIKLYRVTNDKKYLDLAKLLLERRGKTGDKTAKGIHQDTYAQDHIPVVDQTEAVGHSVRAVYMYSAMADIAAITGDKAYLNAVDKLWTNIVSKKMYITGGLGSAPGIEGFDAAYELPNNAYAETCAAIANVYWNHRMFLLHGEAKYMDVLERSLYNGLMAGISLEGEKFFYPNPLVFDGKAKFNQGANCRSSWFDCSCCPSNLSRFVPSVSGYVYGVKNNNVYINLFMDSKASLSVGNKNFELTQKTNYPWAGNVEMIIGSATGKATNLQIRIPGWTQNEAVPSDLYTFITKTNQKTSIKINGKSVAYKIENGYASVSKTWKKGDKITVDFPMESKIIESHPNIKTNLNTLAVQRGPMLYCAEGVDNQNQELSIDQSSSWIPDYQAQFLNGVTILKGKGYDKLNQKPTNITLVPYVVWSHREISPMAVWLNKK
ncbi:MAG: beta-L-arabinofuranosidase domain-containing protein [Bacteroidota bacterium]